MHGGFSGRFCYKFFEQRLCEAVTDHALRVPLHALDPVGISRPFDRFNYSIWRTRHNAQVFPWRENGLVM